MKNNPKSLTTEHDKQNYAIAVHEAGHAVAAYALGLGMTKRGMVLHDVGNGFIGGRAYTRESGLHCQNPQKREFFLKRDIMVSFAGPIAENRVRPAMQVYSDCFLLGLDLAELITSRKQ